MLTTIGNILLFILGLGFLIFLHELGHFLGAKLFKIPVEEFGFGLPPRLFKLFTIGETDFTINALPFGAFVRPKGEADPDVPGGLSTAPPFQRLVVLLGGPVTNLLAGILLFSLVFTRTGIPDESTVKIYQVVANSPAEQNGLKIDDVIRQINGMPVTDMNMLIATVKSNAGSEVTLLVERGSQTFEVRAIPRLDPPPNEGSLGVQLGNPIRDHTTWIQTIPYSVKTAYNQFAALLALPGQLISGAIQPEEARMVGPVGMFQIFQVAGDQDAENARSGDPQQTNNRLFFMAIISVALGITNLLPLPALDGGRIIFLIPEIILKKRVPARYENAVHSIGMLLLLVFMFYITIQDIINPSVGQ